MPYGTKPLPEPMLTCIQRDPVIFIPGLIYLNTQRVNSILFIHFVESQLRFLDDNNLNENPVHIPSGHMPWPLQQ